MSNSKSISVVMPVGNVDGNLVQQLDALSSQTHPEHWQLVVSVNTPNRQNRQRVSSLLANRPNLNAILVDSSDHLGASHARNAGAAVAEGDYLLFCDGDDIVDPRWVTAMDQALARADAVGGHLEEERLMIDSQQGWRPLATPCALPRFLGFPYLITANMGIRADLFAEVGGFDTTLTRGEDIAFSWDLLNLGHKLHYYEDAVVHYRHRKGLWSMMHQHYLYGRGLSEILARRGLPSGQIAGRVVPKPSKRSRLALLKPNGQSVIKRSPVHYLRRGSIAVGRVVGLRSTTTRPRADQLSLPLT